MIVYRACTRLLVFSVIGGASAVASAQLSLNLVGTASGFFGAGPATTYGGLTYVGSTFNANSAPDNSWALGGNAGTPNLNNLGSFSLDTSTFNYSSPPTTFTLDVDFSTPTGIAGGSSTQFVAALAGNVSPGNEGGVQITFPTGAHSFSFDNGTEHGSFTLAVNSIALFPGQKDAVTGQGVANVVPEPSDILGLTAGIGGLGLLRRSRRQRGGSQAA